MKAYWTHLIGSFTSDRHKLCKVMIAGYAAVYVIALIGALLGASQLATLLVFMGVPWSLSLFLVQPGVLGGAFAILVLAVFPLINLFIAFRLCRDRKRDPFE